MKEWLPILRIAMELAVLLFERRQGQKNRSDQSDCTDH